MFFFFYDPNVPAFPDELRTFEKGLAFLSERKSNLSISNARLLIYIANNMDRMLSREGLTLKSIAQEIDVPYGTLGRQIDLLEAGYANFAGLGWIERGIDEKNPKARRLRLSRVGADLCFDLAEVLSGQKSSLRYLYDSTRTDHEN